MANKTKKINRLKRRLALAENMLNLEVSREANRKIVNREHIQPPSFAGDGSVQLNRLIKYMQDVFRKEYRKAELLGDFSDIQFRLYVDELIWRDMLRAFGADYAARSLVDLSGRLPFFDGVKVVRVLASDDQFRMVRID